METGGYPCHCDAARRSGARSSARWSRGAGCTRWPTRTTSRPSPAPRHPVVPVVQPYNTVSHGERGGRRRRSAVGRMAVYDAIRPTPQSLDRVRRYEVVSASPSANPAGSCRCHAAAPGDVDLAVLRVPVRPPYPVPFLTGGVAHANIGVRPTDGTAGGRFVPSGGGATPTLGRDAVFQSGSVRSPSTGRPPASGPRRWPRPGGPIQQPDEHVRMPPLGRRRTVCPPVRSCRPTSRRSTWAPTAAASTPWTPPTRRGPLDRGGAGGRDRRTRPRRRHAVRAHGRQPDRHAQGRGLRVGYLRTPLVGVDQQPRHRAAGGRRRRRCSRVRPTAQSARSPPTAAEPEPPPARRRGLPRPAARSRGHRPCRVGSSTWAPTTGAWSPTAEASPTRDERGRRVR